jgi:hypothetical protein
MHSLCGHYSYQYTRFAFLSALGRLRAVLGGDAPQGQQRLCSSFIPYTEKPDVHYEKYEEVCAAVAVKCGSS